MLAATIEGIGFWTQGLPNWDAASAFARGGALQETPARPAPQLLAANERRRAPDTVAVSLEAALAACGAAGRDPASLPSIFTSTYGDLAISDYMCTTLASDPLAISPTKFHNSVHNAAAGYWTIGAGAMTPATAMSASLGSFAQGLLEALVQRAAGAQAVLLASYDARSVGPLGRVAPSLGLLGSALVLGTPGQAGKPQLHAHLDDGAPSPGDGADAAAAGPVGRQWRQRGAVCRTGPGAARGGPAMSRQPLSREDTAILVPALNEALRIREVVTDALTYCSHVIVIDDGSDDGTAECIAGMPVTLIRHPQRMGKGAALRSGFAQAQRLGMRAVMTMDGDGQHKAADFPRLLAAANRHPGCVIIGARMRKRATQPTIRRIGNDFGDWGIAWGCGFRLIDSQSGQRLYPASVFTLPNVPGEGFVFEAQLLISAARQAGARVVAVPIETRYAGTSPGTFRKSHFRLVRDLWNITSHVVKQVWAYGHVWREYRRVRANPVIVDDPDGEFATVPAVTKSNHSS